ncbi:MAG: c-type cytochrome [Gallionella sp.]
MKFHHLVVSSVALAVSLSAHAANKPETIFVDGNCNNCHTKDFRTVGPTLVEVADKYRNDDGAQARLEKKIRSGGSGVWGILPMPGTRGSITDEDISTVVTWILQQKKSEPKKDAVAK